MLRRTHGGSTMDTVVATQADAPRRRGTKFKLTCHQICELSVAKGPVDGKQGRGHRLSTTRRPRKALPRLGRQPGSASWLSVYLAMSAESASPTMRSCRRSVKRGRATGLLPWQFGLAGRSHSSCGPIARRASHRGPQSHQVALGFECALARCS